MYPLAVLLIEKEILPRVPGPKSNLVSVSIVKFRMAQLTDFEDASVQLALGEGAVGAPDPSAESSRTTRSLLRPAMVSHGR